MSIVCNTLLIYVICVVVTASVLFPQWVMYNVVSLGKGARGGGAGGGGVVRIPPFPFHTAVSAYPSVIT